MYTPVLAFLVVLQLALDHVDHDLVAHETAGVHDLLCFPAKRRLLRDLCAQHVARGLQLVSRHVRHPRRHKHIRDDRRRICP